MYVVLMKFSKISQEGIESKKRLRRKNLQVSEKKNEKEMKKKLQKEKQNQVEKKKEMRKEKGKNK